MAKSEQQQAIPITILMEIVEVFDDYLKCEYRDEIHYANREGVRQDCKECDDGKWEAKYSSAKDCREQNADCISEGVQVTYVAKPLHLQKSPWDTQTIKYNAGLSDEFTITYTFQGTNSQKRIAKYNKENDRCSGGDHVEVVWPEYRARVDPSGKNDAKVEGYIKGDMIQVTKGVYGRADVGIVKILADASDREKALANISLARKTAQFNIDTNVDGRKWSDDCGKGGGGGSVWV